MVPLPMRVEWKSAMMESGAQYVALAGTIGMQLSCAFKWDFKEQVIDHTVIMSYTNVHVTVHIMFIN